VVPVRRKKMVINYGFLYKQLNKHFGKDRTLTIERFRDYVEDSIIGREPKKKEDDSLPEFHMCRGVECPDVMRYTCLRFICEPLPLRQYYWKDTPIDAKGRCEFKIEARDRDEYPDIDFDMSKLKEAKKQGAFD
jgi:hypothetical protein